MLSLLVGLGLTVVGFAIPAAFNDTVAGIVTDIVDHTSTWPNWIRVTPAALALVTHALVVVGLNAWLLLTRRFRRWALMNGAVFLSSLLASLLVVSIDSLADGLGFDRDGAAIFAATAANIMAAATVLRPWISSRLFRTLTVVAVFSTLGVALSAGWSVEGALLPPMPVALAQAQLAGIVAMLGVGVVAGSLVALVFKTRNPNPSREMLEQALVRCRLDVTEVWPARVDARGSQPWMAALDSGERLFVKTLSVDQRAADLLYRGWRMLTLKRSGDREPFTSLRRAVEHEALLSLAAAAHGIRTPKMDAVSAMPEGGFLIAYEAIDGRPISELGSDDASHQLLCELWRQLSLLRNAGIAHRDLRLANIVLDREGSPWVVDFGFAELTADDELLDRDVAQLLASTALVVGPQRAAEAAVASLGRDGVAAGLAWLQPLTLGSATRHAMGGDRQVHHMRDAIATATQIDNVTLPAVQRISLRHILIVVSLAVAIWLLAGQVTDLSVLWASLASLEPSFVALALTASAATYLGATIALTGAVAQRLRLLPTLVAQLASSFTNRLTPAQLGGMATISRYLMRSGVPAPNAVAAIGLNTVVGLSVHVAALVTLAIVAGRSPAELGVPTPSTTALQAFGAALVAASLLALLTKPGRRLVEQHLLRAVKSAMHAIAEVAHRPLRVAQLTVGSALVTGAYTAAMLLALRAAGSDIGYAHAAFAYLAGSAVSTVAPTPGGLGVVEAALVAVYTAVGVETEVAIVAVLLFRVATYWLPILPGWAAFAYLTRTKRL